MRIPSAKSPSGISKDLAFHMEVGSRGIYLNGTFVMKATLQCRCVESLSSVAVASMLCSTKVRFGQSGHSWLMTTYDAKQPHS